VNSALGTNEEYWDTFYTQFNLSEQSSFAEFVVGSVSNPNLILDLGCGNGRDTFYFARATQADVLALDASQVAIETIGLVAEKAKISNRISAQKFDFEANSLRDLHGLDVERSLAGNTVVIYARFLIHALTQVGEDGLWALVSDVLAMSPGSLYLALEYRTPQDAELPKQTPTHFRRFADPSELRERAERLGLSVLLNEQGSGFSVFGIDDAVLCRQIFIRLPYPN
jgi:SAM-dependent methyltransferase